MSKALKASCESAIKSKRAEVATNELSALDNETCTRGLHMPFGIIYTESDSVFNTQSNTESGVQL